MSPQRATRRENILSLVVAIAVAIVGAEPLAASQETDLMVPVRQFIDGFNKRDIKMVEAACAEQTFVIDDFPPHQWRGQKAISRWFHDLVRLSEKDRMSDILVTPSKPRHVHIAGTNAYAVVPIDLRYREKGRLVKTTGLMTLALRKSVEGWRIAACSWTWTNK